MAEKQNPKERLKEITDSIEAGIKELFESDKYKSYLQTMSRFHKYSLNNTMLISMQKPDATFVAGFNKWRDGFSRYVKKGEKSIKIIAPTPYKIKEEREKLDPQTKAPLLDASGKVQTEEVKIQMPMFRVVSVFDVSQTEGEPLPTLASNLTGNVEQFDVFMEAVNRTAPVPIEIKPMSEDTDGYYHIEDKRIAIREGMSEVQTISAAIHEVAHSLLHNREMEKELQAQQGENKKPIKPKDRNTEEVEAESISFAVCSYYGIQTAENSLGYIATWSKGKELAELRASLETINKTSSELISGIDAHFAEIIKERGMDIATETPALEQAPTHDKGKIIEGSSNIEVEGHIGTWYVIDTDKINDTAYFLLEHEEHGDEAACVIVDSDGKLVLDDVWNGFDDLKEHFDIIEPVAATEKAPLPEPPAPEHSHPMPDPDVSVADRNAYGYLSGELLPLSQERAAELFEQDLTVYLLYEDNTEAMVFGVDEIHTHKGLFGIEKADWLALQEHEEMKGTDKLLPEISEQLFLEHSKDAFAIYQLKDGDELRDYRFEGLDWLKSRDLLVERGNYNFVYTEPFTKYASQRDQLEEIWERFNNDHPADFKGHSLSVSDIVAIKQNDVVTYHYCDSYDFKELPQFGEPAPPVPDNFLTGEKVQTPRGSFSLADMTKEQMAAAGYGYHHSSDDGVYHIMGNGTRAFAIRNEDNPLRTAELSTEQNYNQIDGVINNQPTVAELEQTVKAGGTISLLDLANAVKEEKQSVMEQLKTKPPQEKEKPKKAPSFGAEMER
ncbi:YodL domain-containing protein [Anaerotignum sp.]|uniref:YodL domain-containing protein n=1 Tax=Anaerotignum sp. TaxID=2039241 RepID=UPI0028AB873E|nr:YodL domain-containing protein [Anaerotignum sp.]